MNGRMRWWLIGMAGLVYVAGCSGRKSSLLLERQARGSIKDASSVAKAAAWHLTPESQTKTDGNVEVTVRFASAQYLKDLFSNKALFGSYAGKNPFYPEHLVFYVKITNRAQQKIRLSPGEFTLIDDHGNQYSTIGTDYVTAFGESRQPIATSTRGLLEGASPGYFGISLPIGKLVAQKPQGQFALLQQSAMQSGYLYPGVVYDGLLAFWNPPAGQRTLRLLITNVKTDFDANDLPRVSLEFPFEFSAATQ